MDITTSIRGNALDKVGCKDCASAQNISHEVHIVRYIDKDLIIGWDLMGKHSVVLD